MSRLAAWHSGAHSHDGVMHTHDNHHDHDHDVGLDHVQALGQADDAGQQPLLALGDAWPPGDLGLAVDGSEAFGCAGSVSFTSLCAPVPQRPPQA
jgi:hypothetical protein